MGEFYYNGVTFQANCWDNRTESQITGNHDAVPYVHIICDYFDFPIISTCKDGNLNDTANCHPITQYNIPANYSPAEGGTFPKTGVPNLEVYIFADGADGTAKPIGGATRTDANGNFYMEIDITAQNPDGTFSVYVKIPDALKNKAAVPCADISDTVCYLPIAKTINLTADVVKEVRGITLPRDSDMGGAAEIGNANCDDTVDVSDYGILKKAFNSDAFTNTANYHLYADFNGDGYVDVSDYGILKKNMGATLSKTPVKDGNPLCKP